MLKRVQTVDVELGMFIHKLEGNWFSHPFWKSRFLLVDPAMLEALRESSVNGVVIDVSRGKDVESVPPAQTAAMSSNAQVETARPAHSSGFGRATAKAGFTPVPQSLSFARQTPAMPMAREFGRAKRTASSAAKIVSQTFIEMRLGRSISSYGVEPMLDNVYESIQRNLYAFNGLLRCQSDSETLYRHSLAVSALMIAFASHLHFSAAETRDAGMAGLLMDVGASQLPVDLATVGGDYTLLRPELRNQHVLHGYTFLKAAGDIPDDVLRAVLHHHERLDGSGYPHGLTAPVIDQLGRMAAICDTYDTLISSGDPAQRLDPAEALIRLREQPEQFDARLLERFVETVGVYPIGSFVKLRSQRLAMVVDEDPTDSNLPTVRTFWSLPLGKAIKGELIALAHCYGADAIEGVANLQGLKLPDVDKLRQSLLAAACKESG